MLKKITILALLCSIFNLQAGEKAYLIEAKFIKLAFDDKTSWLTDLNKNSNTALKKMLTDDHGLVSFDDIDKNLKKIADELDVLAAPQIITKANSDAEISIVSEKPIQYFKKLKDGNFVLKETKGVKLGLTLGVKLIPESDTLVTLKLHTSIDSINMRKKIAGVNLPVGEPVISNREIDTTLSVELGKTVWFSGYEVTRPNGSVEAILIPIKVSEHDTENKTD